MELQFKINQGVPTAIITVDDMIVYKFICPTMEKVKLVEEFYKNNIQLKDWQHNEPIQQKEINDVIEYITDKGYIQ